MSSHGLVLVAPAGGQDHETPRVAGYLRRLEDAGWAATVVRSLEQVPPLLAAHDGPVGLVGIGQGARLGLTLLAAEPRVAAALLAPTRELPRLGGVTAAVRHVATDGGLVDPDVLEEATGWLLAQLVAPLVCLAGGPLLPPAYLGDLGGLGADVPLVAPTLPTERCDRLVAHLEALRTDLGLERLSLLGHSAGANLAYRYAEHHPDRVDRLVLVTPSTTGVGIPISNAARSAVARGRSDEPWYAESSAALARLQSGRAEPDDPALVSPFLHGRWDDEARAFDAAMDAVRDDEAAAAFSAAGAYDPPATCAALAALDVPVLVVAGSRDVGNPVEAMAEVAALFSRGELVVQEGAGHFPWADDPAAFRAVVGGWL